MESENYRKAISWSSKMTLLGSEVKVSRLVRPDGKEFVALDFLRSNEKNIEIPDCINLINKGSLHCRNLQNLENLYIRGDVVFNNSQSHLNDTVVHFSPYIITNLTYIQPLKISELDLRKCKFLQEYQLKEYIRKWDITSKSDRSLYNTEYCPSRTFGKLIMDFSSTNEWTMGAEFDMCHIKILEIHFQITENLSNQAIEIMEYIMLYMLNVKTKYSGEDEIHKSENYSESSGEKLNFVKATYQANYAASMSYVQNLVLIDDVSNKRITMSKTDVDNYLKEHRYARSYKKFINSMLTTYQAVWNKGKHRW